MTDRRELTPLERDALRWVLDQGDFPGVAELRAQVDSVVVTGARLPIDLELEVPADAARSVCKDGILPVRVLVVDSQDDSVGSIELWVEGGYLAAMEFSWFTDDMPTEYPDPSRLRLWVQERQRVPWWRRKLVLVPLGLFVVLALVAAIVVWAWLPHYRPGLRSGESYGIDVSNHQGEIDWSAVAGDDIGFAYIKSTEGGDWVDPWFERNWADAQSAGIDVGAYHYFTLCRPGAEQAENFLTVVPVEEADLPAALDLEYAGNCSRDVTREWVHDEVAQFLRIVEQATGTEVLLYVGGRFDEKHGITEAFDEPVWQRSLMRRPNGDRWLFWQLTFFSHVTGIDGRVDLDVRRAPPSDS